MQNTITVPKERLIKTLKKNRKKHLKIFEEAQAVYRAQMIKELDRALQDARDGKKIRRAFTLPVPENHVDDFDTALEMLEWDTNEEVELMEYDFCCFVKNEWGWQQSFAANTQSYVAPTKRKKG